MADDPTPEPAWKMFPSFKRLAIFAGVMLVLLVLARFVFRMFG